MEGSRLLLGEGEVPRLLRLQREEVLGSLQGTVSREEGV